MIAHAQESGDFDGHAVLFGKFTRHGLSQFFAEGDFAAGKFPGATLVAGIGTALREEDAACLVENHCTNAHPNRVMSGFHSSLLLSFWAHLRLDLLLTLENVLIALLRLYHAMR